MSTHTIEEIKEMKESSLREYFGKWMEQEKKSGLSDVKFILSNDGNSTVTDAMRQLLIVKKMSLDNQLEKYSD